MNVTASLILGVVLGATAHLSERLKALIGTGFCGAPSTYSTASYEVLRLSGDGARFQAALNVAGSLVAGIGVAAVSWSTRRGHRLSVGSGSTRPASKLLLPRCGSRSEKFTGAS